MSEMQRLVVVGQGYVGLPLAMRAVEVGYDVVGVDVDTVKVSRLADGRSHIDDVSDVDVGDAVATGRYRPITTSDPIPDFAVAVITVPTPLHEGIPDVTFIESAVELVGRHVREGSTVILESTTYPGTTDELVAPWLEAASGLQAGVDFHVGYSPERIDPGNEVWTLVRTPKIVSGLTPTCLTAVTEFYGKLVDGTVAVSSTRVAEMTKLLENTYRHVNIALVNELAVHAQGLGIDIWEVISAASTKPFGFTPFWPGPGVGGHCLPIDPSFLSWRIERQLGVSSRFVLTANDINNQMPAYVVRRVQAGLNARRKSVNGSRVIVLGLAYKANSSDAREAPSTAIIQGLVDLGAEVTVHDDHVGDHEIDGVARRVALTPADVAAADVVLLVTDHDDVDYELVEANAAYVFDTRNRLRGPAVECL